MSGIQVIARLTIHEGRLAEAKVLAEQCMAIVQAKDPGTLQYDWYLEEEGAECVVIENYGDSAAFLAHVENVGEPLGGLLGMADLALEIYGSPTDELRAAMAGFNPRIYAELQSL